MDLDLDMSSLSISRKKRRLSGMFGGLPRCNEPLTEETPTIPSPADLTAPDSPNMPTQSNGSPTEIENRRSLRSTRRRSILASELPVVESEASTSVKPCLDIEKDMKMLKRIYLDKRVKKTCPSLETIFETPSDDDKIMSGRKFKRFISFQDLQKNKLKKRPMKAKNNIINYTKLKKKNKVSMDILLQKLNDVESDDE